MGQPAQDQGLHQRAGAEFGEVRSLRVAQFRVGLLRQGGQHRLHGLANLCYRLHEQLLWRVGERYSHDARRVARALVRARRGKPRRVFCERMFA